MELGQRRSPAEGVAQRLVVLLRPGAVERLQEVDEPEVVVDVAAGRKIQALVLDIASKRCERFVREADTEERLRLLQEALVVADEVKDDQVRLAFAPAKAPPQLLKKEDLRLGRSKVDAG